MIAKSSDGVKWSKIKIKYKDDLYDITWNGKEFFVVGNKALALKSTNGNKWTRVVTVIWHSLRLKVLIKIYIRWWITIYIWWIWSWYLKEKINWFKRYDAYINGIRSFSNYNVNWFHLVVLNI